MTNKQLIATLGWRGLYLSFDEYVMLCRRAHEVPLKNLFKELPFGKLRQHLQELGEWWSVGEKELEWLNKNSVVLLTPTHKDYPRELLQIKYPPMALCVQGATQNLCAGGLAVVGSRDPGSWSVEWLENELPQFLQKRSVTILSGGARGIDQLAHKICVSRRMKTWAFLPSGFYRVYPENFSYWLPRILDYGGVVVSQFSPFQQLFKFHFHLRNELMAVLAKGVFVVEAKERSGSMLTAKMALRHNKDLATLPCCPNLSSGRGNLSLVFDGAQPLRDHRDLVSFWDMISGAHSVNLLESKS